MIKYIHTVQYIFNQELPFSDPHAPFCDYVPLSIKYIEIASFIVTKFLVYSQDCQNIWGRGD